MALFTDTPIITVPAAPFITVDLGTPKIYFARYGSVRWGVGYDPNDLRTSVIKSTDDGASWAIIDQSNSPSTVRDTYGYVSCIFDPSSSGKIHFLGKNVAQNMGYFSLNMGSGAYGSTIISSLPSGFWKVALRANGDILAIFSKKVAGSSINQPLQYSIITGSFGGEIALATGPGGASRFYIPLSTVLDSNGTLHIIFNEAGGAVSDVLWHVSLSSSGSISSPDQIDTAFVPPGKQPTGISAIWNDGAQDHILYANHTGASATGDVNLYDGVPASAPVWTKILVTTLSPKSNQPSFSAHVVVVNNIPYVFWYYTPFGGATSQVQYSIYNGVTCGAVLVAWDQIANPAPGDPVIGANVDEFLITTDGSNFDLIADEYITAGFDQSLVYLTASGTVIQRIHHFY